MFLLKDIKFKNILDIENLEINENVVTVVKGESGSGKSTMLKLLNNIISPDSGIVMYNGVDVNDINPITLRREVIMQSQFPTIFPGNVRENLNFIFTLRGEEGLSDEKLLKSMEIVNLKKDLNDDAQNLSGGEKTRLSIARLFLVKPDVFLLDEPGASLDSKTEEILMNNVIAEIKKRNKTLVFISHSANPEIISDEIITLKDGRVISHER
ncbi:MAG: ATP-binding cassette domain-containing protein [Ezakiella sp.]|uniref:ABC transporter ATP-binding protein n=1 Tax=Ezakiella sp. TaxID=1935205 RepID=UPI0029792155|nr:ATP-binding cassette domain-containing protein [Ezakiella sp.]MDD7731723.1 ATP-binding cassette domain-containing protein [Eubacteriales bacterium]MDY6080034.1 ATP-binding cassette domain-containing protein [Ezakiella sp.]